MSDPLFGPDDPAAPPRANGGLVFSAPWESRIFGLAAALCEHGVFDWDEFRSCLIAEIAAWERGRASAHEWSYYACWQAALEQLLARKSVCSAAELAERERALEALPDAHAQRS